MRRVLITGGTGFVGSHAVDAYLLAGWTVRALLRNPRRETWLTGLPVELAEAALDDTAPLQAAMRDCDVVVHCAGLTKSLNAGDYLRVNADAVERLVVAARENGVRRFVLCSSQAAAGPAARGAVTVETDEPRPVTPYGRSKLEGEVRLQAAAQTMQWVILRPPSVIGPRDLQFVPLFRAAARYGIYPDFGGDHRAYSVVCIYDLARALLRAGEVESGVNETYFVAHRDPLDWSAAAAEIGAAAGRQVRPLRLSAGVMRTAAGMAERLARLRGKPVLLSRDKVDEIFTTGWLCSAEKIRRNWGFECLWSHTQMLRATFAAYREAGWI